MGTFFHAITLIGPDGGRLTVDARVRTGASLTSMSEGILREFGIQPVRRVRPRFADGSSNIQALGEAVAEIDGESVRTLVVFGPEGSPATIGAYTLEGLLLGVDPVEKRLVPLEGWWA